MNKVALLSKGRVRISDPPLLWLGDLIGARPSPWEDFHVPGLMLNAYQIIGMNRRAESYAELLSRFSGIPLMIDSGGFNFLKNPKYCPVDGIEVYGPSQAFEEFVPGLGRDRADFSRVRMGRVDDGLHAVLLDERYQARAIQRAGTASDSVVLTDVKRCVGGGR